VAGLGERTDELFFFEFLLEEMAVSLNGRNGTSRL
jgi:hypothetical protein